MKRWLAAMAMAGVLAAQGGNANLLDMVPKDVDGCAWFNLVAIMDHPVVEEQLGKAEDQPELLRWKGIFAKRNLDLYQAFPAALVFGSQSSGDGCLLLETTVTEAQLSEMLAEENPATPPTKLDQQNVYRLSGKPEEKGVAMYLQPGIIMAAEDVEKLKTYRDQLKQQGALSANQTLTGYRRRIAPGAVAWAVFNNPDPGQAQAQQNPLAAVVGGSLAIYLGDRQDPHAKDDLRVVLRMACKDAQSAAFGVMTLNGLMMMGIGQALSGHPELATDLSRLLQLRPEQQDIVLDANFTGALITRIKNAVNQFNQPEAELQGDTEGDDQLPPLPPLPPPAPAAE